MKLIDSHCHLHDTEFYPDPSARDAAYQRAVYAGVVSICVATDVRSSHEAVEFAATREHAFAVVGVHPHEAARGVEGIGELLAATLGRSTSAPRELQGEERLPEFTSGKSLEGLASPKIIGVGEIGLDYYYNNSPRRAQIAALEQQLQWVVDYDLPVSFHVREAFDDFWPIFDNFRGIRGVLHSFTDTQANLERGFERGLYAGINGISTFTKDVEQQKMYATIPLERMLLETDAPFLTPVPLRGKMNEPSFVGRVAEHMAVLRKVTPDLVSEATTDNARRLFSLP